MPFEGLHDGFGAEHRRCLYNASSDRRRLPLTSLSPPPPPLSLLTTPLNIHNSLQLLLLLSGGEAILSFLRSSSPNTTPLQEEDREHTEGPRCPHHSAVFDFITWPPPLVHVVASLSRLRRQQHGEETAPHEEKLAEKEEAPKAPEAQEAADGHNEELETLRREVDSLRKENEELQQQMRLAERKAADLEDALIKQQAAAEAARSSAEETTAKDNTTAAPMPREGPAPQPSSRAASSAQPEPAAAAEAAEAEAAAAEAAVAEPAAAAAAEETPQEEDKELPPSMPAVAPSQSLQADKPAPQDAGSAAAAAAAGEDGAAAKETAAADRQNSASAVSPSQAASRQGSVKWLRSLLSVTSSRKEGSTSGEPLRSLGGSRSHARQLSAACMRCQELEKEKADLQAKLETAQAQHPHLSSEADPEKGKNEALVARVRNVVQETVVRVDRLQSIYEAALKEASHTNALDQHQKAQRARLHYYGRRKGLEMRIAALLDKVYELEMADPIMPSKPRRLPRASVMRRSVAEPHDSFEGADFPYLLLQLQEEEGEARQTSQGAPSAGRRQTVLVPAHFFDEAAARTAQQRAAAAAQPRPTVVLPAYAFDELALRRAQERAALGQQGRPSIALPPFLFGGEIAGERKDAALAKRPTVAVPGYVFDEAAAMKNFERERDDNRRRPTTAVPTFLFREPRNNPARASIATLPAEWFADDTGDRQPQQQQGGDGPSRQSSFFPSNFFGSFFKRSKEEEEGPPPSPQDQPEAEGGPSPITDDEHLKRKSEPVVIAADREDEAVFPDVAKGGARIRPLAKENSLGASSSVDSPREASQDTAGITGPDADASKPRDEDSFLTAPCCGRATPPADVRPFKRCGCLVCRKCLKTASMQAKVHLNNFVGSDPKTGSPIWKVRCPSCGLVAPLTTTQLRIASIKRVDAA
ncbi:hypothetical protein Emag_007587 [Eimeria magna]